MYLFMAVLGLHYCTSFSLLVVSEGQLLSSYGTQASHYSGFSSCEHRLQSVGSLVAALESRAPAQSCGAGTQLLCGMWDLPRSRIEPMPPALVNRFSTTEQPGKPPLMILKHRCKSESCVELLKITKFDSVEIGGRGQGI